MVRHAQTLPPRSLWLAGALLGLSCCLVIQTLWERGGWQQHQRLQKDLAQLTQQNTQLEATLQHLSQTAQALQQRPEVQAQAIRDELGWVKDRYEMVLQFAP